MTSIGSSERTRRQLLRPIRPWFDGLDQEQFYRFWLLRLLERHGPLTGQQVLTDMEAVGRYFAFERPGYPVLHDLEQRGHVEADEWRPRRYRLTESGQRRARQLASELWPSARSGLDRLESVLRDLFDVEGNESREASLSSRES